MPADGKNQYRNWQLRLSGQLATFSPNNPDPGLYRMRVTPAGADSYFDLVHIHERIDSDTGEILLLADVGRGPDFRSGPALKIWPRCVANPVSKEKALAYKKTGMWFDAVNEPIGVENVANGTTNDPFADQEAVHVLVTSANLWRAANMDIKTQDQADHAANFAAAAGRLEDRLVAHLDKDTKEPKSLIATARTKWKPLIDQANALKTSIKTGWLAPYFESLKDQRAGQEIPRGKIETPISAGTSSARKISFSTRSNVIVNDCRAFLRWLVERNEIVPPEIVEACEKEARRLMREGYKEGEVPGVIIEMKAVVI